MKTKRLPSLLYIFSFIMVLGSALLSFETAEAVHTATIPLDGTPTPADKAPASLPSQTQGAEPPSPTVIGTPSPTATTTPVPTPAPSLAELNASIPIQPADDETGLALTQAVTDYLVAYYTDETLQVKDVSNITCYYKEGVSYADYIVYAVYDIQYTGSNVLIPALDELCVSYEGETITVHPEPLDDTVSEALLLSRASESVSALYLQEMVRKYMKVQLTCDEELISSMVTDASYINMNKLQQQTQYIVDYHNYQYIIRPCPEEVTEFDYIVYLMHELEFISISTLSPGMEEFFLKLDENNYPLIFLGVTSDITDEYIYTSRQQDDFQAAYADVEQRLENAILSDSKLADIWRNITSVPNAAE